MWDTVAFSILPPMLIRLLAGIAGTLCLALGVIGIFVPGLPTTPFLLLAAALYLRSSARIHQKLVNNRYLGKYITQWQAQKGLTVGTKVGSLVLMWTMIALSVFVFLDSRVVEILLVLVGLIGTAVMGFIITTYRGDQ